MKGRWRIAFTSRILLPLLRVVLLSYGLVRSVNMVCLSFHSSRIIHSLVSETTHHCLQVYIQSDDDEQFRISLENANPSKNRPLIIPVPLQTNPHLTPRVFPALYKHLPRMSFQATTEKSLNPTSVASVSLSTQSLAKVEPLIWSPRWIKGILVGQRGQWRFSTFMQSGWLVLIIQREWYDRLRPWCVI